VLHEATFEAQERRLVDPANNGNVDVLLRAIAANSVRRVMYLSSPVMKIRCVQPACMDGQPKCTGTLSA
jgi:hypothetical protein